MQTSQILLVDDDPTLLHMYQHKLTEAGYRVWTANNGQSAWELIESHHLDAIVTDLWMPKMNGLDLLKKLRNHKEYAHLPVIVMTNSIDVNDHEQAINMGIQGFFIKIDSPPSVIARTLNQILQKS